MKKLFLIAVMAITLASCVKSITITNNFESESTGSISMNDVRITHYRDNKVVGYSTIESIPQWETSKKVKLPKNVEYVKISCDFRAIDETLNAKIVNAELFNKYKFEFEPSYYTDDNTTKIIIDDQIATFNKRK